MQLKSLGFVLLMIGLFIVALFKGSDIITFISNAGTAVAPAVDTACVPPLDTVKPIRVGGRWNANRPDNYQNKHWGVDIDAPVGTAVYAVKAGKVHSSNADPQKHTEGWGKFIFLVHNDTTVSVYAHLSSLTVGDGQPVEKGQKIGEVGLTGNAAGGPSHLHLEIGLAGDRRTTSDNRKYTDPQAWLKACGGWREQWNY